MGFAKLCQLRFKFEGEIVTPELSPWFTHIRKNSKNFTAVFFVASYETVSD